MCKVSERDFRPERSLFETSIGRLCPVTNRERDTYAVLQWRLDMNRTDLRYDLVNVLCQTGELPSISNFFKITRYLAFCEISPQYLA